MRTVKVAAGIKRTKVKDRNELILNVSPRSKDTSDTLLGTQS